jgi:hypothetical protein
MEASVLCFLEPGYDRAQGVAYRPKPLAGRPHLATYHELASR